MRVVETNVFQYDELDDRAKERAREWYSRHVFEDSCDWEFVYEDAAEVADILGIDLRQRRVQLMGGGHRYEPSIYFSGFWSQGDGACFEGTYRYAKGATKKIREYAPQDKELHRISDELQAVQRKHFYHLIASMNHTGHYCHSGCMSVEVEHNEDRYRDIGDAEEEITQLMRDFADWIYAALESEYDYQTSDEAVEEAIRANEYEFDENGDRA